MNRSLSTSITGLVFVSALIIYACSLGTTGSMTSPNGEGTILPDGSVFTRSALLESFGACILSEIEAFEEKSRVLTQAANDAIMEEGQLADVQMAWEESIDIWQRLELMQVGPAARKTQPGGKDLRKSIYPWPQRDYCELDQNLVTELYVTNPDSVSTEAKNLWAVEYLLFSTSRENSCDSENEINTSGSWAAIEDNDKALRRTRYAALAARTVSDAAASLLDAWSPSGGDFLGELSQAGNGSRTYGKKRVGLNAVSDALGYIEWGVKDNKLARPLGIFVCDEANCLGEVEAKHSRRSKQHIRNNIIGFRKIFKGCGSQYEGLGFDDYLYAMGSADLAEQIDGAARAVLDALDAIEEADLVTALEVDIESVTALHRTVSTLSNLMRRDFLIVLNLELPQMVQGDND